MKPRLFPGAPSRLAALLLLAGDYPARRRPGMAHLRMQAQTVPQARCMQREFPATPLPAEKIHRFQLSRYG